MINVTRLETYNGSGLLQEETYEQGQLVGCNALAHHGNQQLHQHNLAIWIKT